MCMLDGIIVPLVMYHCEAWAVDENVQKRMNVLEMMSENIMRCEGI